MSCDVLPTDVPGIHYQGDVRDVLHDGWDLMVAHPPCTYLSNSGAGHMYLGKGRVEKAALGYQINQERWANMLAGAAFFKLLWDAPIKHIAVENPIMHGWGMKATEGKADQFVQPWWFGEPESKATGLRLKNLPKLVPTNDVKVLMLSLPKSESHKVHHASPGKDRWKLRSTTYKGVAEAMAAQWAPYIEQQKEAA